ncbi:MAG: type II secretion system GspH family protein [Gammaproteobacteria bacterium]|nr:type II secretion system GspH family protein [Gammaproteobacteria bacterium]
MACICNHFPSSKKYVGFTLVELIVVILLTAILSISIAPRFFAVSAYEDRKTADELLAALRHSQQMAMTRGGGIQLLLTATNFTVQTSAGSGLRSPDGRIPYSKPFPTNVVVTPVPTTISYDRLGRPDAGYSISVGAQTITVEAETGYAH